MTLLIKPILLGIFAASCGVYNSLGFKKNPDSIWVSLAWNGVAALLLFILKPLKNGQTFADLGRKKTVQTAVGLVVEVMAGYVHVVTQYFVLRYLNLGDAMVLSMSFLYSGMLATFFQIVLLKCTGRLFKCFSYA